jgi:pimeloyl-ACP methyl ester carboxylesterase
VALSDMDLWDAVAHLAIPTLVVAGDRDRLTPPDHARRIVEELPEPAGLIVLPETGHMSPLERPHELCAALASLILATRPAAASSPAAAPSMPAAALHGH